MTPQDYEPGDPITTPELLADVLRHEDGVFCCGQWFPCFAVSRAIKRTRLTPTAWLDAGHVVCRAALRCPQTAREMREAQE